MYNFFLFIFLIIDVILITLILLQKDKNANISSSLGTNTFGVLFHVSSSSNFMTRTIAVLTTLFFVISLIMGNINSRKTGKIISNRKEQLVQSTTKAKNTTKQVAVDNPKP